SASAAACDRSRSGCTGRACGTCGACTPLPHRDSASSWHSPPCSEYRSDWTLERLAVLCPLQCCEVVPPPHGEVKAGLIHDMPTIGEQQPSRVIYLHRLDRAQLWSHA